MAVAAHPPEVTISEPEGRSRSGTTASTSTYSSSRRESLSSARTNSDSSVPGPTSFSRSSHVYDPDQPAPYQKAESEKNEAVSDLQRQQMISKRDYAIEISKIMGKQLVSTLKMKGHHFDEGEERR